ncbi:TRAP transporter small permease [Sporosarcina sp. BP05]|uniref:TRAP transporter small permease n=1 Tax=Sporosarcina sp. BP05 TaxID=2758726 RepID=UPI0016486E7B|nr:TRAP transporter small permease [Sporosarcina sp. BP05]
MDKSIGYLNLFMKHFLNLIMAVLTGSVFMQVVFRFVINKPLAWSEELAIYCLVWLTFLGAAYAMSLKAHIGVDFFTELFPISVRKVFFTMTTIASIAFYIIMIVQGYDLARQSMAQLSPVLRLPMGLVYSVIPISGLFLIINLVHLFTKGIKTGGKMV